VHAYWTCARLEWNLMVMLALRRETRVRGEDLYKLL
jgi:hypothetical protein